MTAAREGGPADWKDTMKSCSMRNVIAILPGVVLLPVLAAAQAPERTPWGDPDLQGVWTNRTTTPLERPSEFEERAVLSEEERAEFDAQAEAARDRPPPPGQTGGYNSFWLDRGTDTFAVDGKFRTSIIIDPPNGRMPETTEAAKARFAERAKLRRPNEGVAWWLELDGPGPYDGPESLPISERCMLGFTGATPTFPSGYNNYKRVVQTEDHIMILIEMVHDARIIRLNDEHPSPEERRWLGDSIGWWEGDTLVIDSVHFRPDGFLRGATQDLHVTERLTLKPDGNILYHFTMDDPATWEAPWSGEYIWKRDSERVYEYACHEGNYSMGGTLRGARILEDDWRAGKAASTGGE